MPQTYTGPDGQDYDFPDGMNEDAIRDVFRQKFGGPKQANAPDYAATRPSSPDENVKANLIQPGAMQESGLGTAYSAAKSAGGVAEDIGAGALKSAGSTVYGAAKTLRKSGDAFNAAGGRQAPELAPLPDISKRLTPTNTAQKIGAGAEQIGEFLLPETKLAKGADAIEGAAKGIPYVEKLAKLGAKPALDAAYAGAHEYTNSGGDTDKAKTAAETAGVMSGVVNPMIRSASDSIVPKLLNNVLNVGKKEFRYGRDPIQGVIDEGITANSMKDLHQKIGQRLTQRGQEIEQYLQPFAAHKIDATNAIMQPINEAKNLAVADGNDALFSRLESLERGLTKVHGITPPAGRLGASQLSTQGQVNKVLTDFEPAQLHRVKTAIGKQTKWTGTDNVENVLNDVKKRIYGNLNDEISNVAPGVREMQNRYGELLSAHHGVEDEIAKRASQKLDPLRTRNLILEGILGGGFGFGHPGAGAGAAATVLGADLAAKSPAVVTRLAKVSSSPIPGTIARAAVTKSASNATK